MSKQQKSKNKNQKVNTNDKAKKKLELSKGGMRSPANSRFGKLLLWLLIIAMLSTGLVFLIWQLVEAFTRV